MLVTELGSKYNMNNPTYLANLFGLINCLLSQKSVLKERMEMRKELLSNIFN